MYSIEKKPYGYLLTFGGTIEADEMQKWADESAAALAGAPASFGVVVDMRELTPLEPDAQTTMVKGQQQYKAKGMQRSAVVLANAVTTLQFKRLAQQSGIDAFERYINAKATPDWHSIAVAWVTKGLDPDA